MASPTYQRHEEKTAAGGNALDLDPKVFAYRDPRCIAETIKQAAERSSRRRTEPFRSAMSVLTFYINKEGRKLSVNQLERLEQAKDELRELFGRPRKQQSARRKNEEAEMV